MSDKMVRFSEDLNIAMTEVHTALGRWGLSGWREYLMVRLPDKVESFIVLAHPSDKSDFADQLVRLHKDDVCGDYRLVEIPDMDADLLREFTAAMRAADECFERVGGSTRHYVRDCLWPELQKRGLTLTREAAGEPEMLTALRCIAAMTDPDSPGNYRSDSGEDCLDAVYATARKAIGDASA
jgi:hypothetical protein